ncbi:hypothetical protein L3Q82_006615 [Scortum barcoo]|uniref:Uncharacterized protein n=1 Tax=Scortum barcoo TaxID=214431 RepID=A0ACB8WZ37_9TELE|nr:hypothetical protein L3Q82_006615 [Scortum barcoo]
MNPPHAAEERAVFTQLKPVRMSAADGAEDASVFEDVKPGTQLELDKYLPQVNSSLLSLSADAGDKKYRRESASVVDEYFSEEKPTAPYSLNINVILPSTTHLRTGLYRPNTKTLTPQQIKTEPGLEVPCSLTNTTQALPDFTSVFSMPPAVNNVFIKPDISGEGSVPAGSQQQQQQPNLDTELHIGPPAPQPQVYHMPITSCADLTMTLSQSSPSAHGSTGGRTMLNLGGVALPTNNGNYMMAEQQLPQHHGYYQASPTSSSQHTAPHSLPPSPPNSQPGSPDGQVELHSLAPQLPPPYQQRLGGLKVTGLSPHALLMTHGQGVLTGPKYNRRNNPELEKRRIHFCDYPEEHQGPLRRPDWRYRGPTLEPGLGLGLAGERLVAGSLPTGPKGRAQPEMATWARLPVGSPPAGRSMRGRCNVVWVAVVAGGLDDPIPGPKLWQ